MKLYTKDFTKLTEEELSSKRQYEDIERRIHSNDDFNVIPSEHLEAIRHYKSWFPNNYLCRTDLSANKTEVSKLKTVLRIPVRRKN